METNEIIIGHNAASESCCWIAPSLMNGALCLAGCLTGATVGAYLRSCRNTEAREKGSILVKIQTRKTQ